LEYRKGQSENAMKAGFFQGTEMPVGDWWQVLWPDPGRVLIDAGLIAGSSAIDVCAGDGWFTLPMARIARHVTAVDIDPVVLNRARLRLSDAGLANCEFKVADALDLLGQISQPVDFVFLANAFHGVPDQIELSRAIAAILSKGGRFAVVNWHHRPRQETSVLGEPRGPRTELRMSPDSVKAVVETSGLTLLHLADIRPYHYVSVFAKP